MSDKMVELGLYKSPEGFRENPTEPFTNLEIVYLAMRGQLDYNRYDRHDVLVMVETFRTDREAYYNIWGWK